LRSSSTRRTLGPGRTSWTLRSARSLRSRRTLGPGRTSWTLRSARSLRSSSTRRTLGPGRTSWTRRSARSLRSSSAEDHCGLCRTAGFSNRRKTDVVSFILDACDQRCLGFCRDERKTGAQRQNRTENRKRHQTLTSAGPHHRLNMSDSPNRFQRTRFFLSPPPSSF
jgi:hypothetical protein